MTNFWKIFASIALGLACVFLLLAFFYKPVSAAGLGLKLAENYDPYLRYNGGYYSNLPIATTAISGFESLATAAVNVFNGSTIVNDLIQGSAGYATTTTFSNTITVPAWCSGTAILIPPGTGNITLTFPNATTTFAACGASLGSWSTQWIDNESSNSVTIATSTGGSGLRFFYSSSTPAQGTYPPTVLASSTLELVGQYVASGTGQGINLYGTIFNHPFGIGPSN